MLNDVQIRALALYKAPFRFDKRGGYIFDADNNMVADGDGSILRVRGWGRISYMPDPAQLQDAVGQIIVMALNDFWQTHTDGGVSDV